MTTYFSTFISGLQEPVKKALEQDLKNIKVKLLLDGLVVYETDKPIMEIKNLRYLNNTFILFRLLKEEVQMQNLVKSVLREPDILSRVPSELLKKVHSFRVIASKENQFVSVDKNILAKVEELISKKLKLKLNRSLPDVEVWFLMRNEGYSFVGLRITKTPNYEKTLHKGELRPELANIMCLLTELKPNDVVLDPFAGYGSIPLECAKYFKVSRIYAGEKDKSIFKPLLEKSKGLSPKLIVGKWDGLNLSSLTDNTIDKIITDPPWGVYQKETMDIKSFYEDMLKEFIRLVKSNGLLVILTAQKELFENLLNTFSQFELVGKYDVLVSGKKAAIYKMRLK